MIYQAIQLGLREFIGNMNFDDLMSDKNSVSDYIIQKYQTEFAKIGLNLKQAGMKDIILPGEIREIMNRVLIAEKTAESRAKAEDVLAELKKGADFATLAKESSADVSSAAKGGDLGYFAKGRMVPEFDAAAFALQKSGETSGLVETKFGYHILQLDDRRPPRTRPFEEVRDELMKEVRTSAAQDARVAEAQKIQQGAKINQDAVEAFAASYKTAK